MSRSFRKNYHHGIAGDSDKKGKQAANRVFRHKEKQAIQSNKLYKLPYRVREVYNVWSMPKDGKIYYGLWRHDPKNKQYFIEHTRK